MPINEIDETRALITLEEARLFVLRNAADQTRDELLIDAINDVSAAIWDYCKREFLPTATAVTRVFGYDGQGALDISPYDLRAVTGSGIVLYTDRAAASQVTLTTAQYRLDPRGTTPEGTYLAVALPVPSLAEVDYGFGWQLAIHGDWGMAAVPRHAKMAAKQWVENLVKNPGSYASTQSAGFQVFPEQDEIGRRAGMPPAVRHRLESLRRKNDRTLSSIRLQSPNTFAPIVPHTLPTL